MWSFSRMHRAYQGAVVHWLLLRLLLALAPASAHRRLRVQLPIPIINNSLEPVLGQDRTDTNSVRAEENLQTTFPSTRTPPHLDAPGKTRTEGTSEPQLIIITEDPPQNELGYRLPRALQPLHYNITVQPFINGNYSIHGSVQIDMVVLQATDNITLHVLDLDVQLNTVKLTPAGGSLPAITHFSSDKVRQVFLIHLNETLQPGRRLRCSMDYIARLNESRGFYATKYTDNLGHERNILSTFFQTTFARKAFPCFDEPGMKATFQLHVVREENMTAISNMPLLTTTPMADQDGWVMDHFDVSPPMSTYHLILIVSQLEYVDATSHGNIPIRVWARPEVLRHTTFIQEIASKLLAFVEEYLSVRYPLPKLDFVAVPGNIKTAFEGWGIILAYDEFFLVHDPATDDESHKQDILNIQAHEVAHQWFGDLVTPDWWNDIWLSEGFASYLHHLAVNHLSPMNNTVEEDILETTQAILYEDSWESHSINLPVFRPEEIEYIFNSIAYYKGTCIIHMMSHILSKDTFRMGITDFLNTWKYKNARQDDLWRHLTQAGHQQGTLASGMTVKMIMDTWTLQSGYPLITVVRSPDGTSATVYQERFHLSVDGNSTDGRFDKWWVPITYTSQDTANFSDTQVKIWMKDTETQIRIPSLPSRDHWVIFNLQEINFYRVNYDDHNWKLLIHQLMTDHQAIHLTNRAQLIDDALDLALAGKLPYKTALDVTEYLVNETNELPWAACFNNIELIESLLKDTPAYTGIQKYLLSLLVPLFKVIGIENVSLTQDIQKQHSEMVKWACSLDHPDCIHLAQTLYWQWMKNLEDIQ
ncbi:aminopeptidase N-like isoform X2 [Panulirus ornatus]